MRHSEETVLTQCIQQKCAGCGKFKIIDLREIEHGFTGPRRHLADAFGVLWDLKENLCPECNMKAREPIQFKPRFHPGWPIIESPRGVFISPPAV